MLSFIIWCNSLFSLPVCLVGNGRAIIQGNIENIYKFNWHWIWGTKIHLSRAGTHWMARTTVRGYCVRALFKLSMNGGRLMK